MLVSLKRETSIEINPFFFFFLFLDYMTLGKPPYHCHSGNLRVLAARKGGKERKKEKRKVLMIVNSDNRIK